MASTLTSRSLPLRSPLAQHAKKLNSTSSDETSSSASSLVVTALPEKTVTAASKQRAESISLGRDRPASNRSSSPDNFRTFAQDVSSPTAGYSGSPSSFPLKPLAKPAPKSASQLPSQPTLITETKKFSSSLVPSSSLVRSSSLVPSSPPILSQPPSTTKLPIITPTTNTFKHPPPIHRPSISPPATLNPPFNPPQHYQEYRARTATLENSSSSSSSRGWRGRGELGRGERERERGEQRSYFPSRLKSERRDYRPVPPRNYRDVDNFSRPREEYPRPREDYFSKAQRERAERFARFEQEELEREATSRPVPNLPKRGDVRDRYMEMTPEEQSDAREQIMRDFKFMQAKYPNLNIPIPDFDSSLEYIHYCYTTTKDQLDAIDNANTYTTYLAWGFWVTEMVFKYLEFNADNYFVTQMNNLTQYRAVMFEFGKKHGGSLTEGWSVEWRLAALIILQGLIFAGCKFAETKKWTGGNISADQVIEAVNKRVHKYSKNFFEGGGASGREGGEQSEEDDDILERDPVRACKDEMEEMRDHPDEDPVNFAKTPASQPTIPSINPGEMLNGIGNVVKMFGGGGGGGGIMNALGTLNNLMGGGGTASPPRNESSPLPRNNSPVLPRLSPAINSDEGKGSPSSPRTMKTKLAFQLKD